MITENKNTTETFAIQITNPMLYDKIHTLSAEYSVSVDLLVNVAIQRLIDDVDFIRQLRMGKITQDNNTTDYFPQSK